MIQMLPAVLTLLACVPAAGSLVTAPSELSILEGRSLAVPCHYDHTLASHVKYWCRGTFKDLCSMVVRTDQAAADPRVSIADDPAQQVFTVAMADLAEDQTGWYHCGVEHGGIWTKDDSAAVYVTVVHGMTVVDSPVEGVEGGQVSVDCQYSTRYRNVEKRWCRSGDQGSCVSTGPDGRHEGPAVTLADDLVGTFSVTLRDLRMADAGWYWCGVGGQQNRVQVVVMPRPPTTPRTVFTTQAPSLSPEHIVTDAQLTQRHILDGVLIFGSFILLAVVAVFAVKIWKRQKEQRRRRQAEQLSARLRVFPEDVDEASIMFHNKDTENPSEIYANI